MSDSSTRWNAPTADETDAKGWVAAVRASHDRLAAMVEPLDAEQVEQPAYPSEWTIAQVLSHMGSQSEIFGRFLDAGLKGEEPPGQEAFPPIWDAWNAKSPQAQAADAIAVDRAFVERLEAMDDDQLANLHLALFGMDLDVSGLLRMRLGEHAVHSWDVAVALDPTATVDPGSVALLLDLLGMLAARAGKPLDRHVRIAVTTAGPDRRLVLDIDETVTITEADTGGADDLADLPQLRLPAEAFLRLVYGRLDPAHTPPLETEGVDLGELRQVFPGF